MQTTHSQHSPVMLRFRSVFLSLLLTSMPFVMGCSHKQAKPDNDTYPALSSDRVSTHPGTDGMTSDRGNAYGLQTVRFSFDSQLLDETAKLELKANAQVLRQNPVLKIQVEGHCDSRGGIQYNIALGERRAQAVKHFLEDLGIRSDRISTISYGKERPLDTAETEEAYAKNRRANFVVTQGMI